MSTEVTDMSDVDAAPPIPPIAEPDFGGEEPANEPAERPAAPAKTDDKPKEKPRAYTPLAERREHSAVAKAVKANQDKSLREVIESFGSDGSYQVIIDRTEPDQCFDPVSARTFSTAGFCGKFENKVIDEEFIQQRYGGGTYVVKFKDRKASGSGWQFAGQVTVRVSGDPNLAEMRAKAGVAPSTNGAATTQQGENPSIVKEAMGIVADQLKRADERSKEGGGNDAMFEMMREELRAARADAAEARREMREFANRPAAKAEPARSPMEEKMFAALLEGDSARVTSLRTTQDSELRTLKEGHRQDIEHLNARHAMQLQDVKSSHDREVTALRQSHEVALSSVKGSFETQLTAAKASFDLQKSLLESENKRLDREITELRSDLKELRAKKDLSPVEMIKQIESIKNAVGGDDEESSTGAKIVDAITNPATWEGVGAMIGGLRTPQPAAQPTAEQQAMAKPKRQIVRNKAGERFILEPDGTLKGPLPPKEKAKDAAPEGGDAAPAEPQMPAVDPGQIALVVSFLESAYSGNQDPEVVAQGARSRVPEEMLTAIRDHGVDAVMSKMAKLQSSSPLSSQAGRNWVRKLGKALVGE